MPRMFSLPSLILGFFIASFGHYAMSGPCLVLPKGAAEYQIKEGGYNAPHSTMECASLKVMTGEVKAFFFAPDGKQKARSFKVGESFNLGETEGASSSFVAVLDDYRQMLAEGPAQKKPGRKFFDEPEALGLPSGNVYVPAEGLAFVLRGADGQPLSYRLIDDESGKLIVQGEGVGGQPLLIAKIGLLPGGLYLLSARFAERDVESSLQVVGSEVADELREALLRIDGDASLDAEDRRFTKALLFEEFALGYNRHLTLKGMTK